MTLESALRARLEFLARVTDKECRHLLDTDGRLFAGELALEDLRQIQADPILAERLDAFVGRLQPEWAN